MTSSTSVLKMNFSLWIKKVALCPVTFRLTYFVSTAQTLMILMKLSDKWSDCKVIMWKTTSSGKISSTSSWWPTNCTTIHNSLQRYYVKSCSHLFKNMLLLSNLDMSLAIFLMMTAHWPLSKRWPYLNKLKKWLICSTPCLGWKS